MRLKFTFLLGCMLLGFSNYAQQKACGYAEHMQEKLQDPEFRLEYEAQQAAFQLEYERLLANPGERLQTIFIPVAVHYTSGNESDRACLEDLARDQIRILNEDFLSLNDDISNWDTASSNYPGVNLGAIDVQFVLATQNHPSGVDPDIVEGGPAVTVGNAVQDSDSRWAGYQNFLVYNLGGGILGYSPLGGRPSRGDSVVQTNTAFGSGTGCPGFRPGAPYNLGRTVTHELGHHYNLYHTFDGCGQGDRVDDTPAVSSPSYGCPSPGSVSSCVSSERSLTMNFMDYTNDACMYMFTEGQAIRMNAYINTIKDDWKDDVLSVDSFAINKVYSIYPNPANNELNISLISNAVREASYVVYDILGKAVFKGDLSLDNNIQSRKINTSQLTNGVYLLKIDSGKVSATKKIVVKH